MKHAYVAIAVALLLAVTAIAVKFGRQPAAALPAETETRLTEIEKRLDYLTSEIAEQRGAVERINEKLEME